MVVREESGPVVLDFADPLAEAMAELGARVIVAAGRLCSAGVFTGVSLHRMHLGARVGRVLGPVRAVVVEESLL